MCRPSGENAGSSTVSWPLVSGTEVPSARRESQRLDTRCSSPPVFSTVVRTQAASEPSGDTVHEEALSASRISSTVQVPESGAAASAAAPANVAAPARIKVRMWRLLSIGDASPPAGPLEVRGGRGLRERG